LAILRQCAHLQWCELSGSGHCASTRQLLVREIIEQHAAAAAEVSTAPVATKRVVTVAPSSASSCDRAAAELDRGNASSSAPSPSSSRASLVLTHAHLVALFLDDVAVEFWRGVRLPRVERTHQSTYRHDLAPVFVACPSLTSFAAFSDAGWQCAEPPDDEAALRLKRATLLAADAQTQSARSPSSLSSSSSSFLPVLASEAAPRSTPFRVPEHFLYLDEPALAALPQALAWFPHLRTLMLPRTAPTWAISALAALLPRLPALLKIDMARTLDAERPQARAPEPPSGDDALRRAAAAVEAYSDLGAAALACGSRLAEIALSPLQSREHNDAIARAVRVALPAWTVKWIF
jgi:hypothetical protein